MLHPYYCPSLRLELKGGAKKATKVAVTTATCAFAPQGHAHLDDQEIKPGSPCTRIGSWTRARCRRPASGLLVPETLSLPISCIRFGPRRVRGKCGVWPVRGGDLRVCLGHHVLASHASFCLGTYGGVVRLCRSSSTRIAAFPLRNRAPRQSEASSCIKGGFAE